MTFTELISLLEKQVKLHKSLYQLALKKTEALKKQDIEMLTALMKDEQKHIFAIQQLENNRLYFMQQHGLAEATMTSCIERADGQERLQLMELYEQLVHFIEQIKEVNDLNRQLTEQALQFIYLTLDMMMPQTQPVNYSKTNTYDEPLERSVFESKA
ncbi:flagellar biosynthesis/type III secretory pathway chaperone [Anoxybacillus tepidamans]|uniref:Flagellar biosynthesis/type III secretory pathway chaperone n=1 Tax=Anoxybacteroides tepidamans TaxID=265948 RepID=A0A7W8IPC1_9BACL|nr:flagellar protein FlgN [Anoxybacillus tepidamans]MBB5324263.1 flagellar biosynthesis/type III secretory pathway chaperone [Anoxybacillus tepidamans]